MNVEFGFFIRLFFIVLIFLFLNTLLKKNREYFSFSKDFVIETGVSPMEASGSISFTKEYSSPPVVFTQMTGKEGTNDAYSIQVFGVTTQGFEYSKNVLKNNVIHPSEGSDMVALNLSPDGDGVFQWMAFYEK